MKEEFRQQAKILVESKMDFIILEVRSDSYEKGKAKAFNVSVQIIS